MDFINSVFNELNNMFYGQGGYKSFPLDLVEIKDGFTVVAELPGVKGRYSNEL